MNPLIRTPALWLTVVLAGSMGGCSSGAHSAASRSPKPNSSSVASLPAEPHPPTYLAPLTCWDTVSCCVERNPFTAVESCGADPMRVAEILKALAEVYATLESTPVTEETPTEEETEAAQTEGQVEAAGQPIPRWRRKCIMTYALCVDEKWSGRCDECLRLCVGQRKWPKDRCPNPQNRN